MRIRRILVASVTTFVVATLVPLGVAGPAAAHPPGGFGVQCPISHVLKDDPIMHPGMPGASHRHAFYGNRSTNANSTYDSMLASGTTCTDGDPPKDLAAEWVPTAEIKKGGEWRYLKAYRMRIYYFPSIRDKLGPMANLPKNIKIIGGNPDATSTRQNPAVAWFCGEGSPIRRFPYDCSGYTLPKEDGIRAIISLPYCWDGERKDSPDHVSHVIYADPTDTSPHTEPAPCPDTHPVNIPSVSIRLHFALKDPCMGAPCAPKLKGKNVKIRFSSGPWWTLHADFWNTWVQSRLNALTDTCLRAHVECGILGEVERDV
jgi:hypothetical protein